MMRTPPMIGEPVVVAGRKYRIREIEDGKARCADAGPHWRTGPIVAFVALEALEWDRTVAVWRHRGR